MTGSAIRGGYLRLVAIVATLFIPLGLMVAPGSIFGQGSDLPLSVSLMAGYRDGGRFEDPRTGARSNLDGDASVGLVLGYEFERGNAWELLYTRQQTALPAADVDVDIAYLHLGGRLEFAGHAFVPYLSGGVGATRISARGTNTGSELRPSLSVTGGLEWPLAARLALRLEARGYLTMGAGDQGLLCMSATDDAFCQLAWSGDVLGQIEVMGGMTFRF
jgi:opacity protein-like surface antigen